MFGHMGHGVRLASQFWRLKRGRHQQKHAITSSMKAWRKPLIVKQHDPLKDTTEVSLVIFKAQFSLGEVCNLEKKSNSFCKKRGYNRKEPILKTISFWNILSIMVLSFSRIRFILT